MDTAMVKAAALKDLARMQVRNAMMPEFQSAVNEKTIIKDDRDDSQMDWPMVSAQDTFMGGWGEAKGRTSYAAWACDPSFPIDRLERWVKGRSDMVRAHRVCGGHQFPAKAGHVHIYVVTSMDHPSMA